MKITFAFVFFISFLTVKNIDKNLIYKSLSSNNKLQVETLISTLQKKENTSINRAYRGALLTKKASFEKAVQSKIKYFKAGATLLESEISKFPKQTEYRFLRLCIQENCPKILGYNKNIQEDVLLISTNYSQQSNLLKKIIYDYAKNSNALDHTLLK